MISQRKLAAHFYRTATGREPVREWLRALASDESKQIGEDIAYVQYKWPIGKPRVDHLRAGVWEIRSTLGTRIARTLFAVVDAEIVLLHGFIKKTQQTPAREIDTAVSRLKEWNHGKG